jgi:hypothetical protein
MKGVIEMLSKRSATILMVMVMSLIFTFAGRAAFDRHGMISEQRRGYEVDDWIERGESSVTESPRFKDGIRLAARATRRGDDYALASAIYFFQIPERARTIKIKVDYDGKSVGDDFDGDSVGRVWIRSPRTGRYEDADETLYGDTFVLRERKRHEEIEIPARGHTLDGTMELHVIAEDGQIIDLKRIEVKTYTRSPDVRVVNREYRETRTRRRSSYWHFYAGQVHLFGNRHYVRYVHPGHLRIGISKRIRIPRIRIRLPHFRLQWRGRPHVTKRVYRERKPVRLRKWTPLHKEVRERYR